MDSSEGFVKLREEILNQAIPLLDSDTIPTEDRFRLTLQIAQTKGTLSLYEKAFRLVQSMESEDKLTAYLDLLSEVDYKIQEANEGNQDMALQSADNVSVNATAAPNTVPQGQEVPLPPQPQA